jgi:hypothetical protein
VTALRFLVPKIVNLSPNRPTTADVVAALRGAPRFMATHGLTERDLERLAERHIGEGQYAQVYALPSGLILKITDDPDDVTAAEIIRRANKRGSHPAGLPSVIDVKRFRDEVVENETDYDSRRPIFAIVYEAVVPLKGSLSDEQRAAIRALLPDMSRARTWRAQCFASCRRARRQSGLRFRDGRVPARAGSHARDRHRPDRMQLGRARAERL